MTGIDQISSAILAQAQSEADALLAAAQTEAEHILASGKARAEEFSARIIGSAEAEARDISARADMTAGLTSRRTVAAKKQELIDLAFDAALEELLHLPEAQYVDLLCKLAQRANEDGAGGQIVLNEKDKSLYADRLSQTFSGTGLTVSETGANMKGGLILKRQNMDINCALEIMVYAMKSELSLTIADILFAGDAS